MNTIHNLIFSIMVITTWGCLFPEGALFLIAGMKGRLRRWVIYRTGNDRARELGQRFHDWAVRKNIDPYLIEQALAQHQNYIKERLGRIAADQILGEADPINYET